MQDLERHLVGEGPRHRAEVVVAVVAVDEHLVHARGGERAQALGQGGAATTASPSEVARSIVSTPATTWPSSRMAKALTPRTARRTRA